MQAKYYTFRETPRNPYDIEASQKPFASQKAEDEKFIWGLVRFSMLKKGDRKQIEGFLAYQLDNTTSDPLDFIRHTKELVEGNEVRLKPYLKASGYAIAWLTQKAKKLKVVNQLFVSTVTEKQVQKPINSVKSKKADPSFEQIVKDPKKMAEIIAILKSKEIIDSDFTWRGNSEGAIKMQLVALIILLEEKKIIHPKPKAQLGRIFSAKFNCPMNPRNYSTVPKEDILEKIRKSIDL